MQLIKEIILAEVKEQRSLSQVRIKLEDVFQQPLSYVDENYFQRKYIKYTFKLWLQNITDIISEVEDIDVITNVLHSINNAQSLKDVPDLFKQKTYFNLTECKVTSDMENIILFKFKNNFIHEINTYSYSVKNGFLFLKSFSNFLNNSNNEINDELNLVEFHNRLYSFDNVIQKVINCDKINDVFLKNAAKVLHDDKSKHLLIETKIRNIVAEHLRPVEFNTINNNDRVFIEIKYKNLIISEILPKLESAILKDSKIDEIRFIAANSIHIDENLKKHIWHGKNITIFTRRIKMIGNIEWDVSGNNADRNFITSAGTSANGYGEQGLDGNAGESGGNILILSEYIDDGGHLNIISNGGRGGNGQAGGSGRNGEDGIGVTDHEYNTLFSSPIYALTTKKRDVNTVLQNIRNKSQIIYKDWRRGDDVYIESLTDNGNKISFSLYMSKIIFTETQAFFLCKGSPGQQGKQGGEFGLGGKGGFAGEIIVNTLDDNSPINITAICGRDGDNGEGGCNGKNGKQGFDRGWIHSEYWKRAVHFGSDQNSTVSLVYYNSTSSDRIWCPYEHYNGNERVWVEMQESPVKSKYLESYQHTKNIRQNYSRKHNAIASRKKTLSKQNVIDAYSNIFTYTENTIDKFNSQIENLIRTAKESVINQKNPTKHKSEINSIRSITIDKYREGFNFLNIDNSFKLTVNTQKMPNSNNIVEIPKESNRSEEQMQLNKYELILKQLQKLFQMRLNRTQSLETLLIRKYRLSILKEIGQSLQPYSKNFKIASPQNVERYFKEANVPENGIQHDTLGYLNSYIFENTLERRTKIIKFCKQFPSKTELISSLKAYILEIGKLPETHFNIKCYYNDFKMYSDLRENRIKKYFSAFNSDIIRSIHKVAFDLWLKDGCNLFNEDLEVVIKQDKFSNFIYNKLKRELELQYCWNKCTEDDDVLNAYFKHLEKSPISGCYRELLAYIFNVNIRMYREDESTFNLIDSHNPSSKVTVNLLLKNNKPIELINNKNYTELDLLRNYKDERYNEILSHIFNINVKRDIDVYFNDRLFLFEKTTNINKNKLISDVNEDVYISKIAGYYCDKKEYLKTKLEKISFQHIKQNNLLCYISERFETEGNYISFHEIIFFIDSVISSYLRNENLSNTYSWIVASYSQKDWIGELILMQLEDHLKMKLKETMTWRMYLKTIEKDNLICFGEKAGNVPAGSFTIDQFNEILYLLSNIDGTILNLDKFEMSEWPYVLKNQYWMCKLRNLVIWDENKLISATYHLMSIENMFGSLIAHELLENCDIKRRQLTPDTLTGILSNIHNERWCLSNEDIKKLNIYSIKEWIENMQRQLIFDDKHRDVSQLASIVTDSNTSDGIKMNLHNVVRAIKKNPYNNLIEVKPVKDYTEEDIKTWSRKIRIKVADKQHDINIHGLMLAVIDRAIQLKKGFNLRDTQLLSILILLENKTSTLAQISTGEGKTITVVATAIMKVLYGQKVDIVTSSPVLAKRDAISNKAIYNLFDIDVSHNCWEDIENRKEAYSNNMVVYGDLSNFQRDYLLDRFFGNNVLGDRTFINVIVDEVDSMLLDKSNNILYLSHDIAGLDKLEAVYIYIWHWINRPVKDDEDISHALNIKAIKDSILSNINDRLMMHNIGNLDLNLSSLEQSIIWDKLVKGEIIDFKGNILKRDVAVDELKAILTFEFDYLLWRLKHTLTQCKAENNFINLPNYLKPFVEEHLDTWIKSAFTAYFMETGQDYVVDVDRSGTNTDLNAKIIILDKDTGTDQVCAQWDEALHQFLQLKHGCKISMQSLKAVFISNVSYFKLYSKLYGVTGTLGSDLERSILKQVYNVDFLTVPTTKLKKFHEDSPILCKNQEDWMNNIYRNAIEFTSKQRSVLIICQTITEVEFLHKYFIHKCDNNVHIYTRDYEEFEVAQGEKTLGTGQIIIATNLAGRGTDIKLSEELQKAGGLRVCLSYLPSNSRVEQQGFGRAARNGEMGSGQLILNTKGYLSDIFKLKTDRDTKELQRVMNVKTCYRNQISTEENCFIIFKDLYTQIEKKFVRDNVPDRVKSIILQSCLDKWAFWLDANHKYLNKEDNITFNHKFNNFISDLHEVIKFDNTDYNHWLESLKDNPMNFLQLGKYFVETKNFTDAITIFDEIIKQEPNFSEAAHYFKAFALSKKLEWNPNSTNKDSKENYRVIKKELRLAAKLFVNHSKLGANHAGVINEIRKGNRENLSEDAYSEQKNTISGIYHIFLKSINDIIGHSVNPQTFATVGICDELSEIIFKDLIEEKILKRSKVRKLNLEHIETIAFEYSVSVNLLHMFLLQFELLEINENEFRKLLKAQIKLPSLEEFWNNLITRKLLTNETKYIIVNALKLRNVDPSMLRSLDEKLKNGQLQAQDMKLDVNEIHIYPDRVKEQIQSSNLVFKKSQFKTLITKYKYESLKTLHIFSHNKKASVSWLNKPHADLKLFNSYDSITIDDFTIVNISKSDAELILRDLVKQNIIEEIKLNKNNSPITYKLKIPSEEICNVKISFCSVYDQIVKRLLFLRFMYRVAFEKFAMKFVETDVPINFNLLSKPHTRLMYELYENDIIKPPRVSRINKRDTKRKLMKRYYLPMPEGELIYLISHNEQLKDHCPSTVIRHLIEKRWISIQWKNTYNIEQNIVRLPLDSLYNNIEDSLKLCLDNRSKLATKDIIEQIICTLERLKSTAKSLDVPNNQLHPLNKMCHMNKLSDIEEICVMKLNGLDSVQELEEMKWTGKMILNCIAVILMGIVQIAIGVVILLFTTGLGTHFGSAFIGEGINDIFFGVTTLTTGYFKWEDYMKHKSTSLLFTFITFGIGAFISKGIKLSTFGYKLFGPTLEVAGKKASAISGKQLIQIVGRKRIYKKVLQDVVSNTAKGVALGVTAYGIDILIDNCLKNICRDIGRTILGNIEQQLNEHSLLNSAKQMFKMIGDRKAKNVITTLTEKYITKQNVTEEFLPVMSNIASSVLQGIQVAINKNNMTCTPINVRINLKLINMIMVWVNRLGQIANIKIATTKLLNDLNNELKIKINEFKLDKIDSNVHNSNEVDNFTNDIVKYWKTLIQEKASHVIERYIVSPILNDGTNHIMKRISKQLKNEYLHHKENSFRKNYEDLIVNKKNYIKKIYNKSAAIVLSEFEKRLHSKYHDNLLNLMKKTKSPKLFAAIIRENVPMDLTCVSACPEILFKYLKQKRIDASGITIVVQGENGVRQEFTTLSGNADKTIIFLNLKENHFYFSKNDVNHKTSKLLDNNCLYNGLIQALPELGNTPAERFRCEIADHIETNDAIQHHIKQGWHQIPLLLELFGGRQKTDILLDENDSMEDVFKVRAVDKHLVARFTEYIRLGGEVQRIAEKTNLCREDIVVGGKSEVQDKHGSHQFPAGHVLRVQLGKPLKEIKDSDYYKELKNILGYTHIVPSFANDWHGIGGDFDKLQSSLLHKLAQIDYSTNMTFGDERVIQSIKNEFIMTLNNRLKDSRLCNEQRLELLKARNEIKIMETRNIFQKGTDGYWGLHGKQLASNCRFEC